jgi:odorant receptor
MMFEIFLPCYFGNELSHASSKLSTAVFHSNWIEEELSYKKSLIVLMENLKKDMKITAFGIIDVNLETFKNAVQSAYSLHAVLKNLNSK